MSSRPTPLVVTVLLAVGLGASLLVIAFLLGRESARAPAAVTPETVPAPPTLTFKLSTFLLLSLGASGRPPPVFQSGEFQLQAKLPRILQTGTEPHKAQEMVCGKHVAAAQAALSTLTSPEGLSHF